MTLRCLEMLYEQRMTKLVFPKFSSILILILAKKKIIVIIWERLIKDRNVKCL